MTYWVEIAGSENGDPLLFDPIPVPDWAFSGKPNVQGVFENTHFITTGPCRWSHSDSLYISILDDEDRVVSFVQMNGFVYHLTPGTFLNFAPGNLQVTLD